VEYERHNVDTASDQDRPTNERRLTGKVKVKLSLEQAAEAHTGQ
jgi:hypothetical protein